MNAESYIKQLCELLQLDIDAVLMLTKTVLKHINEPEIHKEIAQLQVKNVTVLRFKTL
jgi:hypothetical protein